MKAIQYLTDQNGNKTAAVVPIEEWNIMQREMEYGIPDWHKDILEAREPELHQTGKSWEEVKSKLRRKS